MTMTAAHLATITDNAPCECILWTYSTTVDNEAVTVSYITYTYLN
jgi:hypothetical protein